MFQQVRVGPTMNCVAFEHPPVSASSAAIEGPSHGDEKKAHGEPPPRARLSGTILEGE
jgi:hypothetical protein